MISGLLAAGGVLLLTVHFSSNVQIIVIISIILLIILEALKRISYETFNRQRIAKENINNIVYFFMLLFGSLSVFSSYVGSEHTINFFAASPALIDTANINTQFKEKTALNAKYWNVLITQENKRAKQINQNNNWRGVTVRGARSTEQKAIKNAQNYKDSLLKYESIIKAEQRNAVATAQDENKETTKENKAFLKNFGGWLALASIFFEISLFLILFWCASYEDREIKEALTLIKDDRNEIKDETKDKEKKRVITPVNSDTLTPLVANKIGFGKNKDKVKDETKDTPKDGRIIGPTGKQRTARIYVPIDGELHLLRPSDIKNHIRGNKPDRQKELEKYLNELELYKNEKRN
jgi:hypothetical protein